MGSGDGNCVVCGRRITMSCWVPFCCEVCFDSEDAQTRREMDAGLFETLLREDVVSDVPLSLREGL